MKRSCGKQSTVGEIVNHMSVDCQRIQDAFVFSSFIVLLFVITGLAVLQLWGLMGKRYLTSVLRNKNLLRLKTTIRLFL